MKLSQDAEIVMDKLINYLLRPQARGDKSAFLALAGYTAQHADRLLQDLRSLVRTQEAEALESTVYGRLYQIRSKLVGPSGRSLTVKTIWMTEHLSGRTKFITLVPDKEPADS